MKKVSLTILAIILGVSYAKPMDCFVFLTFKDCSICYSSIDNLDNISKNLSPNIVVRSAYEKTYRKILKQVYNYDCSLPVIISDSLYEQYAVGLTSKIIIIDDKNEVLFESEIKYLATDIDLLNLFALGTGEAQIYSHIPDDTLLDEFQGLYTYGDRVLIQDYKPHRLYEVFDTGFQLLLDGKKIDKTFIHEQYFGHKEGIQNLIIFEKYLKSGMDLLELGQPYICDKGIYLMLEYHFPHTFKRNGKEILKIESLFLLGFLKGDSLIAFPVDSPVSPFDIDEYNNIKVIDSVCYISVFKDDLKRPNYFIAEYKKENNQLKYDRMLPLELPKFFRKHKLVYSTNNIYYRGNELFFTSTKSIFDLNTYEEYVIKQLKDGVDYSNPDQPYSRFTFYDLRSIDEYTLLLVQADRKVKRIMLNRNTSEIVFEEDLELDEQTFRTLPKFFKDSIIYMNKDNDLILIK
jgi:hypothetical protein